MSAETLLQSYRAVFERAGLNYGLAEDEGAIYFETGGENWESQGRVVVHFPDLEDGEEEPVIVFTAVDILVPIGSFTHERRHAVGQLLHLLNGEIEFGAYQIHAYTDELRFHAGQILPYGGGWTDDSLMSAVVMAADTVDLHIDAIRAATDDTPGGLAYAEFLLDGIASEERKPDPEEIPLIARWLGLELMAAETTGDKELISRIDTAAARIELPDNWRDLATPDNPQ